MKKILQLLLPIVISCSYCLAQPSTPSNSSTNSPPVDSNQYYSYAAKLVKDKFLSAYGGDSTGDRGLAKYSRWDNFWKVRLNQDVSSGGSLFGTINRAIDAEMREPAFCLGSGFAVVGVFTNNKCASNTLTPYAQEQALVISCYPASYEAISEFGTNKK